MSSSTSYSDVVLLCHKFSVLQYPLLDKRRNGKNLVRTCFSEKTQTKHHIVESKTLAVQRTKVPSLKVFFQMIQF